MSSSVCCRCYGVRLTSKLSDRQAVSVERHVELQIVRYRKIESSEESNVRWRH
jgi:hypothetical protein